LARDCHISITRNEGFPEFDGFSLENYFSSSP